MATGLVPMSSLQHPRDTSLKALLWRAARFVADLTQLLDLLQCGRKNSGSSPSMAVLAVLDGHL